jgi:predicted DNA-binding protein
MAQSLSTRLGEELEGRLDRLARLTGRNKSF